MKSHLLALALLTATITVEAKDPAAPSAEPTAVQRKSSPEFERLKSLIGTWKGTTDMGEGPVEIVSQYRPLAGGSVVEEKCFVGTPNEMTTMFYDRDGKLALTHYCMLGNRPGMTLKSADDKTLRFAFDKDCGINVSKESHMHALTLRLEDADTMVVTCKAFIDGKEIPEKPTTLKRVKSS
jgi:hypothetical protein